VAYWIEKPSKPHQLLRHIMKQTANNHSGRSYHLRRLTLQRLRFVMKFYLKC